MTSISDETSRRAILDAALTILTTQGHHALSVRRVASEAGCSTIGVYTWFGGKDGLVDALWIEAFTSFGTALRKIRPLTGPFGRLRAQAFAYRKWALAHPAHYQLMFFNVIPEHVPSDDALVAAAAAYTALLSAVEEALGRGELRFTDTALVAHSCWAMAHGLVTLQIANAGLRGQTDNEKQNKAAFALAIDALMVGLSTQPDVSTKPRATKAI